MNPRGIKITKIRETIHKNNNGICMHDYKNAIKVGNVDYQCPLCNKLLDPKEWFFMNSFEFIEVWWIKLWKKYRIIKNQRV